MKAKELREELSRATSGRVSGWRLNHKSKELGPGEYAFIRNDYHCRGWRIVLHPGNKWVELQQKDPGIDTKGCDCTIRDAEGFPVPDPGCSKCGGAWEIPIDYRGYEATRYSDPGKRKHFEKVLIDLYFYDIHPLMRGFYND